jgi:hypothetical protein
MSATSTRIEMAASLAPPPARLGGFLILTSLIAGVFTESFVLGWLIVPGNAGVTAQNILGSESIYRLGYAADLVDYTFYLAATAILYDLFKPVSRNCSMAAAFFSLVGSAVVASVSLYYLLPLTLLGAAAPSPALDASQLQALALLSLKLRTVGYNVSLVFFGIHFLLIGWLTMRATFLPHIFGLLGMIGGIGYMIHSLAYFLSPTFASHFAPYILLPGVLAQALLAVWLLAIGVNNSAWQKQACAKEMRA